MRIPKMAKNAQYRITVPALNGGVNFSDPPNLVGDNQLTDVKNMWWKDQALRTRPGVHADKDMAFFIGQTNQSDRLDYKFYPSVRVYEGGKAFDYISGFYSVEGSRLETAFFLCRFNDKGNMDWKKELLFDSNDGPESENPYTENAFLFTSAPTKNSVGLYIVLDNGQIYTVRPGSSSGPNTLEQIPPSEMYAPLVVINARGRKTEDAGVSIPTRNGTLLEGYNLLCGAFRTAFTTEDTYAFLLPQENLTANPGENIIVEYTGGNGAVYTWVIPPDKDIVSIDIGGKQIFARIIRVSGGLYFLDSDGVTAYHLPKVKDNNLVVTAWKTDPNALEKIAHMRCSVWFGGDRSGLNGGTRLFVAGNKAHPNLVHWSDINNPLYFPENNYAYIGQSSQSVTGFGKQSNLLIIFKEKEIYSTEYVAGNNYTAQDVLDGKVVDVTANSAVFPITPINSGIGCDCPHTIQLCNNRLVWATSEGRVYGLMAANQASERNVRELSAMVGKLLETNRPLKNALSCDFNGQYLLFVQNKVYVLDYMDGAFQYYSSYSDERQAQRKMPWHIWEIPQEIDVSVLISDSGRLSFLSGQEARRWDDIYGKWEKKLFAVLYNLEGYDDVLAVPQFIGDAICEVRPISSMFQTKIFDFGVPDRRKTIRRLHMGASAPTDAVRLSYITDGGTMTDAGEWSGSAGDGIIGRAVTPGVSRSAQFGVRAECPAGFSTGGMVIRYELGGEVK